MSQARNDVEDSRDNRASQSLDRMIRQGRSFSGRERNCLFLNTMGDGQNGDRFANVSAVSGLDFPDDGRALALVDWDHDGDEDLWFSNRNAPRLRFLRNDSPPDNHFVQLHLVGNGIDTNRNAVGARVTLVVRQAASSEGNPSPASRPMIKTLRAGEGFLSQSSAWLHFGIGPSTAIEQVRVRWPNGQSTVEEFGPLQCDARYELIQSSGTARLVSPASRQLALRPSPLRVPPVTSKQRIPLVYQVPAPRLGYYDFNKQPHAFDAARGQPTLVNFWSSTCRPCLKELSEFAERYDELTDAGVRVLALSVDGLQSNDPQSVEAAEALVDRLELPFDAGLAPAAVMQEFQRLHNMVINMERPLAMPTSILIDRQGKIDVIYKGPVAVDTLLADAQVQGLTQLDRMVRAAAFPGTAVDSEIINSPLMTAAVHFTAARELLAMNRSLEATSEYEEALKHAPNSAIVHNDIAVLNLQQGNTETAVRHFATAVQLDPHDPALRINLARVLVTQRKFEEARRQLDRAVATDPENAEAHFNLGVLLLQLNNVSGAQESFERAILCNANHAGAHFNLGNVYVSRGQTTKAKECYQKALQSVPNEAAVLASLGKILLDEGDLAEAENHFRKAIEHRPGFADTHYQLGLALQKQKKYQEAKRQFETALQIDSSHRAARAALQQMIAGQ